MTCSKAIEDTVRIAGAIVLGVALGEGLGWVLVWISEAVRP